MKILIGTSGWTYDHWKGNFYPAELPKKAWFDFYAAWFCSVEVNATFYRSFADQTYHNWRERSPNGFGFVLKAPRWITHEKHLENVTSDIQQFFRSTRLLKEKFELILLQIAPDTPYDPDRLRRALSDFSDPRKVAVEFRSDAWNNPEFEALLREMDVTYCDADFPVRRVTRRTTSSQAYLRLHGRANWYADSYSDGDLQ